jgi:hypothetical protein
MNLFPEAFHQPGIKGAFFFDNLAPAGPSVA